MSGGVKQPPRLLEQLLVQPTSSGTPKRNGNAPKRSIQLTVDEHSRDTPMKRKNKDFVDSAVRAITADEGLSDLLNLDVCQCESDPEESLVVITTKLLHYYEPAKHMSRLRLVLSGNGSYYIQVLLSTVEEGNVATAEDFKILCEKIADSRNFKFCPGISLEEYERCKQVIGYDPKNVRIIDVPIKRIESVKCEHWFPLSRGRTTKEKQQASELLCRECIKLQQYLASSVRRLSGVTPEKHQQADSCYPMKYLSPQSLQRRKLNIKSVRAKEKRMLRKYVPKEIILDKERAEKRQLHVNFITGEKNNIIE